MDRFQDFVPWPVGLTEYMQCPKRMSGHKEVPLPYKDMENYMYLNGSGIEPWREQNAELSNRTVDFHRGGWPVYCACRRHSLADKWTFHSCDPSPLDSEKLLEDPSAVDISITGCFVEGLLMHMS